MTRDETIALFLECEARRSETRKAALDQGKSENEAETIAHDAAKRLWNEWADALLAEKKAMETEDRWDAGQEDWRTRAEADFSFCLFLNKVGVNEEKEADIKAAIEKSAAKAERDVKSIPVEALVTRFDGFVFPGDAWFARATLSGVALFDSATFKGAAWFARATLSGVALFDSATFKGAASFGRATLSGVALFDSATFSGDALFDSATFSGDALFDSATFKGAAWFASATFSGAASFRGRTFPGDVFFNAARFGPGEADFSLVTFERVAQFDGATFTGEADFNAVSGKRTFSMSGAQFEGVPNFIQAHFEEAPRLDNVVVTQPNHAELLSGDKALDLFARWRELKRLAIQAHDTDRELEFNAQEIAPSAAFALACAPQTCQRKKWQASLRSLSGWLYGVFSDYGRSLFRPLIAWSICIAVFAGVLS